MFYLGTARTGQGAKKRKQQERNWKKRDDGWKVWNQTGTPKDNVKKEIEETGNVRKVGKWSKSNGLGLRRSYGVVDVEDEDI